MNFPAENLQTILIMVGRLEDKYVSHIFKQVSYCFCTKDQMNIVI